MTTLRISVEWGFAKIGNHFKFVRDADYKKVLLQPVGKFLPVAVLLANIHTCMYGSEFSIYFNCYPPSAQIYVED